MKIETRFDIGSKIYIIPSKTNYKLNISNKRDYLNRVVEQTISEIRINNYGISVICYVDNLPFTYYKERRLNNECLAFETEQFFGETWFLTKTEAEQALKRLEGKDE